MAIEANVLAELKEKLLEEKTRIESDLKRIAKPGNVEGDYNTTFNEIGTDEDENATEVEEYTDNLALETTLEKQLRDIIEALERIEAGTYGKCENCDAEIPVERLKAYPAAKTCTRC
ncbi:MAG TPA: TraR/DksA C4-type zinc finger protein [Patescibacteria group bacterium]